MPNSCFLGVRAGVAFLAVVTSCLAQAEQPQDVANPERESSLIAGSEVAEALGDSGACCDPIAAACSQTAQAECSCPECEWTGGVSCDQVSCKATPSAIPTTSEWGLVILTLLLLSGAKAQFGYPSRWSA